MFYYSCNKIDNIAVSISLKAQTIKTCNAIHNHKQKKNIQTTEFLEVVGMHIFLGPQRVGYRTCASLLLWNYILYF